ncbi:hypothetical protein Taro_053091 [Colocasia esculenta]|uniref:Glycosyltransferase n=1 Tax=Colocasia esculenta TaxID=4460 RepID=A0A843XM46_COLES|nr:hypothetical protein [Colocasia esculenta]
MEKEREENAGRVQVVLLTYPTQGHINPMLEFGKRLAARGLPATVAITRFVARSMPQPEKTAGVVRVVGNISDGHDEGGIAVAESVQSYLEGFKAAGSRTLAELIREEDARGRPVRGVVYDAFLPWALDVAKGMGLLAAAFFTQSCAVNAIYHHAYHGRLPVPAPGQTMSIEGLPALSLEEMPSFISRPGQYPEVLDLVLNQYLNLEKADAVFVNTFYHLEPQEANWMASILSTKTIGPTIPTMYLGSRMEEENKHYGFDIYTTPQRETCGNWLDAQEEPASVVYVSFGSMADLSAEQVEELAWGLTATGKRFLWVVRASEEGKLPEGFVAEVAGKGLVVRWCAQLEVLAHPAVGCFVTHSGWNSTLEALSLGVPMVAVPQWTDQPTNAKYVEEVWGTGVRARVDGKGVVRRDELRSRIREVMEGKKAEEIRQNAQKWRKLAAEAVGDGGSSDRNMWEFVRTVIG